MENPPLCFTEAFQVFGLDHAAQGGGIAAPTAYRLVMRHDLVELETFLPRKRLYRFIQRTRKCVTLRLRESVQLPLNFEYRLFKIDTQLPRASTVLLQLPGFMLPVLHRVGRHAHTLIAARG